jgi:hypothetical protein
MGYFLSERDQQHPDNKKVSVEGFDGPAKSRRCTDCLCLVSCSVCGCPMRGKSWQLTIAFVQLILVGSWVVLTALGLVLMGFVDSPYLEPGNPYRFAPVITVALGVGCGSGH